MGFLSRFRNYRADTSMRIFDDELATRNAPPTFVPDLILEETWNRDDLHHLEAVACGDPFAHYIVNKLAENAFDDWFMFVDDKGNEIMQDVQYEFVRLNAKRALTQALSYERTFGWAYLYTGKNRYVPQTREGGRIAALHPFTPIECVVKEYNEFGEPKTMEVTVNVGQGEYTTAEQKIQLPASDFIFWNTRPIGRGYKGRSALYAVWDMLVYLRYVYHSMTFYDMKIAAGIFTILTKVGIPDELVSKLNTALEDISIKRSLVLDGSKVEMPTFIGPTANATNFETHINACMEAVAAGTSLPKDVLVGASAGALQAGEINIKSLFQTLNQIQTSVEPYIRDTVRRMGHSNENYGIEWNVRYAHNEEEQSKIAMNNAQTLAIRSKWLTINEIREAEGMPAREDGDRLSSDFEIGVSGMQSAQQKENTHNPKGENI